MSYNLSQIMKSAHRNYKKGGKTFSELPLTTTQIVLITVHITSEINQIIQQWIKEPN